METVNRFSDKVVALALERYLQSHSGKAITRKRLLKPGTAMSWRHRTPYRSSASGFSVVPAPGFSGTR